ncbi:MAG: hypothetical protein ACREJD_03145 [Phycisphaerales bacterium]
MTVKTILACFAMTTVAGSSLAATISLSGPVDQTGAGFGSVLSVLALQGNGSEAGGVAWNGAIDVQSGDAKPFSQTRTVSEIVASGANLSTFGVVLNIAQPGGNPNITLNQFDVVFYSASGSELFVASFNTPTVLAQIGGGVGNAGYLFNITFDPFEANFFADATNRIGIRVTNPIMGSLGAPENFYLVPSPSAMMFVGGAGLLATLRRRRA